MKNRKLAQLLLIATFVVSSPRWVGLFASVIGINLIDAWPIFKWFEIGSGFFAALLEGAALAYLSATWKNYTKKNEERNIYWYSLLIGQIMMLILIPLVITPYLVSAQLSQAVSEILPGYLLWFWTFFVAALNPFMAIAIGLLEDEEQTENQQYTKQTIAYGLLSDKGQLSPQKLAQQLQIPVEDAAMYIANWHNRFNGNGANQ